MFFIIILFMKQYENNEIKHMLTESNFLKFSFSDV